MKNNHALFGVLLMFILAAGLAFGQSPALRITMDQAIRMAIQRNHTLLAQRTTVHQSEAQEITANNRPNPIFFADWEYLPLFSRSPDLKLADYLQSSTEGDIGISYLFERGQKRQHRLQAAKDATAVARSTVADNERTLGSQVGSLFINVQLAEATI